MLSFSLSRHGQTATDGANRGELTDVARARTNSVSTAGADLNAPQKVSRTSIMASSNESEAKDATPGTALPNSSVSNDATRIQTRQPSSGSLSAGLPMKAKHTAPAMEEEYDLHFNTKKKQPSNRADIFVQRLESWSYVMKQMEAWLAETIRITIDNSSEYFHKAKPHVEYKSDRRLKAAADVLMHSLDFLTKEISMSQQEAAEKLKKYHQSLADLRRECKDLIQRLKNMPVLRVDELLKRKQNTQKAIQDLKKLCENPVPGGHDPWLYNRNVIYALRREVTDENRLWDNILPVQREVSNLDRKIIDTLRPIAQFYFTRHSSFLLNRSQSIVTKASEFEHMLLQMDAKQEWNKFLQMHKDFLIVTQHPRRDYQKISYPNRFNPLVMTLLSGVLELRSTGPFPKYAKRELVITPCGYLHIFKSNEGEPPEKSFFLPKMEIVPPASLQNGASSAGDQENILEIRKIASGKRNEQSSFIRASSPEELMRWYHLLEQVRAKKGQPYVIPPPAPQLQPQQPAHVIPEQPLQTIPERPPQFIRDHPPQVMPDEPPHAIPEQPPQLIQEQPPQASLQQPQQQQPQQKQPPSPVAVSVPEPAPEPKTPLNNLDQDHYQSDILSLPRSFTQKTPDLEQGSPTPLTPRSKPALRAASPTTPVEPSNTVQGSLVEAPKVSEVAPTESISNNSNTTTITAAATALTDTPPALPSKSSKRRLLVTTEITPRPPPTSQLPPTPPAGQYPPIFTAVKTPKPSMETLPAGYDQAYEPQLNWDAILDDWAE